MMADAQELIAREDQAWNRMWEAVERVPVGDRHIYGPEGIDFYTRTKAVTSRWPDPATSKVDLGFPQTR